MIIWFNIKREDDFFSLGKTCSLFSCATRERTIMSDEKAKERKRLYDHHWKHSKRWQYQPMSWHRWKFYFWPKVEGWDEKDIVFAAAKQQNATKIFGTQKLIDPPEGWKYGFPKKLPLGFNVDDADSLKEWLVDNGYPAHLISDKIRCRVWEEVRKD